MSEVRGLTTIKYVKQGDTLTCGLRSTLPLKQFITNDCRTVSPSFVANSPCIYPVVKSALTNSRVQPNATGYKWLYNNLELTFDANGLSTAVGSIAAGTFKSEWKSVDGDFAVPTLSIKKNLASASNINADVIEFQGVANTGFAANVSASIEISIEQTDGEAVVGYISVNNGGVIDDNTSALVATAHLLIGGVAPSSGVTYAWYKMVVTNGVDSWVSQNHTSQSINIGASAINSNELYKCVMTYSGKTTEAVLEVADETDALIIYPNPTDGNSNTVAEELSSSQTSIIYVPKVYKRSTSTEVSGCAFSYSLTNSSGTVIASAASGSSFTVTRTHAVAAGGDLTLIITATL